MSDILGLLLDNAKDGRSRAAIRAGWELGQDLPLGEVGLAQIRKEIAKAAEAVAKEMMLDEDLVHGAALLSMAISKEYNQP